MGLGGSYIGEGNYHERDEKGIVTKEYKLWRAMLQRCYGNSYKERENTYEGCSVCEEWLNFQNFAKWVSENYYEIPDTKVHLDKDVIVSDNKQYSPEYCCFLPMEINLIFSKNNSLNNSRFVGVDEIHNKRSVKYKARCRFSKGVHKTSKTCDTFEEAKEIYYDMKNDRIHSVAEKYKEYLPKKVYDILVNVDFRDREN